MDIEAMREPTEEMIRKGMFNPFPGESPRLEVDDCRETFRAMIDAALDDPMEKIVRDALESAGILFVEERDQRACGLDFYLPIVDVHIEVKQFHTDRISEQMSRVPNVIAIQGIEAARLFAKMLAR